MVASAIAAAAPSLISAGASFGLSKLFGGGKKKKSAPQQFKPPGIDAGGLRSRFSRGSVNVTSDPQRQDFVGGLASTFPEQAGLIGGLRAQVTPGFGRLTTSRLAQVERGRSRAIGNLRENLQRRRVLGSSFAGDALSRAEAGFAEQSEQVAAESFLQELDLNQKLLQQEFTARRGEFQTQLDELNLQVDVATKLASGATQTLGANARLKAELDAREQEGAGRFFGQTFQPFIDKIGEIGGGLVSSAFGGAPAAA